MPGGRLRFDTDAAQGVSRAIRMLRERLEVAQGAVTPGEAAAGDARLAERLAAFAQRSREVCDGVARRLDALEARAADACERFDRADTALGGTTRGRTR